MKLITKVINMKLRKTLTTTILALTTFSLLTNFALAAEEVGYMKRDSWKADEELSKDAEQKYSLVDKIYVTGITTQDKQIRIDTESWVKGLYYFFSTKTQFKDLPFNYLVGWDGMVYEGKNEEEDLVAPIENESAVLIGYLSNYDNAEMTPLGKIALETLLSDLVSQNNLNSDDILAKDWHIKPTDNLQKTYIQVSPPEKTSLISNVLSDIKETLNYSAPLIVKNYSAEIANVDYTKELKIGDTTEVKLKVKNSSETNWYKDSPAEITVAKQDGTASGFYISGEWLSNSQTSAMTTDSVKSQSETELTFNISAPFTTDESYLENFVLKTKSGSIVNGSEFSITVKVSTEGLQIVEVLQTPTDYLNVRATPSSGGQLITQVLPGEKYVLLESQSGWGKLRLKTGEEGWAAKQYLKEL